MSRFILTLLILLTGTSGSILAQDIPTSLSDVDPDRLEDITRLEEAERARLETITSDRNKVRGEIDKLRAKLVKMSAKLRGFESTSAELTQKLEDLNAQELALKQKIGGERENLQRLLAALQRIESNPPPALAVSPQDAADAARAGIFMSKLSVQLNERAERLGVQLIALEKLRAEIQTEQAALDKNEVKLNKQLSSIEKTVGQKKALEANLSRDHKKAQARADALAKEASSLQDLIARLERGVGNVIPRLKPKPGSEETKNTPQTRSSRPSDPVKLPDGTLPFASATKAMKPPVTGTLSKGYSSSHPGLSIRTNKRAQITAPYPGRVEFSGAFKNYDNVVILNVGDGYFVLLTGLGELYAQNGENVTSGEPLGLMPQDSSSPKLYLEVRRNGKTINPSPWFGTAFAKG